MDGITIVAIILIACCFISEWIEKSNKGMPSRQNKQIEKLEQEVEELKRK